MEHLPQQRRVYLFLCFWIACIAGGIFSVAAYSNAPTPSGHQPSAWPANSAVRRASNRPTLLLLLHPKCSCSHATLYELTRLLGQAAVPVDVHILLYGPANAEKSWQQGSLVEEARSVPGAKITVDPSGVEASHFGMSVSGQTALYSASGRLLFSGGITAARGHSGDNAGHSAIQSMLSGTPSAIQRTPVFGCSIKSEL